jgi:uncharacterized membrane protein
MQNWILFSLLSSLLFAFVSVIDKYGVYDKTSLHPKLFNMYVGFSNLIIGLLFLLIWGFTLPISVFTLLAFCVGLIQGLSLIILFWALSKHDVTRVMPLWASYPFWVVLIAFYFTGENLLLSDIIFMSLIIVGSIFSNIKITTNFLSIFGFKIFPIVILGTIIFATSQVINKEVVQNLPILESHGLRGIGVCFSLALPFSSISNFKKLKKYVFNFNSSKYIFLAESLIAPFAYISILIALINGPVSIVAAISGSRPIFIVLIYLFLGIFKAPINETFNLNELFIKALSAILVGVGVFGIGYY